MSAGDVLLTIVIWLYKNTLLNLPTEVAGLSLSSFTDFLDGIEANLTYSFSGISHLFPLDWAFIFISVIIAGELIMFLIRQIVFLINVIRGSGA